MEGRRHHSYVYASLHLHDGSIRCYRIARLAEQKIEAADCLEPNSAPQAGSHRWAQNFHCSFRNADK